MGIFQQNLIKNLLKIDNENRYHIIGAVSEQDYACTNAIAKPYAGSVDLVSRNLFICNYMKTNKVDSLLATFNISPLLAEKYAVFLVSHDWSHGIREKWRITNITGTIYQRMHVMAARRAKINIANSRFTASETLKLAKRRAFVVYHDCDPFYKAKISSKFEKSIIPLEDDYILYVGRVRPAYKNISSPSTVPKWA